MAPKIKNAAQIAAAQAANTAAAAGRAEATARATAAQAIVQPIAQKAIPGISALTAGINAKIAELSGTAKTGSYNPITGGYTPVQSSSQLVQQSRDILGAITPTEIATGNTAAANYQKALTDAAGFQNVDVPTAVYEEEKKRSSNAAYDTIEKILESYNITGIASVLESIRDEYPEATSEDLLTLLQFDDRYNAKFNARFAANANRMKAGMPVLTPKDYLKLEQGYIKIFNAYNLPTFKTQAYYDKLISADLELDEVTERVQLGYDRVLSDKAVQTTFNKFFSALGFSDIVAGMLDPINQLPALERKVKAAEIGGAALRQGLVPSELAATEAQANVGYTNVSRGTVGADVLAGQGLTKAQAEAGYIKIAQLLPTAEKLSSIYGGTEQQYGLLEAEQEQLQGLASAARKRQRLTDIETAQFRRDSGLGKGALSSITNV
jgi:hypothetical protein